MGQLTLTTPLSGKIFSSAGLGLAMVNKCTKFEVSRFTQYEAMAVQNAENGGGLGQLGVTQGQPQCHHSIERIRLPIRL